MPTKPTHILLVEDSPDDADILMEFLNEACPEEFVFTHVFYLRNALEELLRESPDVVLQDLNLPDSEGIETFRRLHAAAPQLPVVVLTGIADETVAIEAVKQGAQDYLVKGEVDANRISRAVRFAIERQRNLREAGTPGTDAIGQTLPIQEVPTVVGDYHIVRTLGEGNTGIVFLVEKDGTGPSPSFQAALKILRPAGLPDHRSTELTERFLQEAEILSGFDHPNIVKVFEFGKTQAKGIPYMVMEYLTGTRLRDLVGKRDDLSFAQKVSIVRQLADALEAIHQGGVCHRDIKPDNILVSEELVPTITDFGIARKPFSELTGKLEILGTPLYMAPEAFVSAHTDPRADIFSLGALFYELLLGQPPFTGDTVPQLARRIRRTLPTEPRKLVPDLPFALQQILARMLRKRPDKRYQAAAELVHDLDAFLQDEPRAKPQPLGNRLLAHVLPKIWS